MRFLLLPIVSLLWLSAISGSAYAKTPAKIGFYNVQNLFDTVNNPSVNDAAFSDSTTNNYSRKLGEVAAAIALFNPDMLGVCEVENYGVVRELALRTARLRSVVHYDSRDTRGIDVALLYDSTLFTLRASELIPTHLLKRDFLRAEFHTKPDNAVFVVYVVHLPSKLGGKGAAARRQRANEMLDSLAAADFFSSVIICGDFNDNPVERRLLYNTSAAPFANGRGSYAYRDVWSMIDQILVTPTLLPSLKGDQKVVDHPSLIQSQGRYRGYPRRNRPSDHLPVYIDIEL